MMFSEGNGLDLATFINTTCRGGSGYSNGNGDGNGFGGEGNGFLWLLLFLMMGGRGFGNGWGNNMGGTTDGSSTNGAATCCCVEKAVAEARAAGLSDQVVLDAIRGNSTAISQIASTLNCGFGDIQNAICAIDKSILQLSGQLGMSSQQIINSIQAGNCDLSRQLADCCCEMKQLVTTMNYENRIANMEQTNHLTGVMNAGFFNIGNKLDAGFQGIKDYFTAEKINALQLENSQLRQNNTLQAVVDAATTPIQTRVDTLLARSTPLPIPAYPAPQYATGYTFGIMPTNNFGWGCHTNWNNNGCGCGCGSNNFCNA